MRNATARPGKGTVVLKILGDKVSMKFWDYPQADKNFPRKVIGGKIHKKSLPLRFMNLISG
jgi:hypothetical protein